MMVLIKINALWALKTECGCFFFVFSSLNPALRLGLLFLFHRKRNFSEIKINIVPNTNSTSKYHEHFITLKISKETNKWNLCFPIRLHFYRSEITSDVTLTFIMVIKLREIAKIPGKNLKYWSLPSSVVPTWQQIYYRRFVLQNAVFGRQALMQQPKRFMTSAKTRHKSQ